MEQEASAPSLAWRHNELRYVATELLSQATILAFYTMICICCLGTCIYVLVILAQEPRIWILIAVYPVMLFMVVWGSAAVMPAVCMETVPPCLRLLGQLLRLLYQIARAWVWRRGNGDETNPLLRPVSCGAYVAGQEGIPAALEHQECAVCLGEVRAGEMVKLLPVCRHAFHQRCIDQWLRYRSTCPLYRCIAFAPPPVQTV